jgi:hypothetical protein
MNMDDDQSQGDFLSSVTDISMMRFLLEDLHDDLLGKVQRFHYLNDLGEQNGRRTMLFGGQITHNAWVEARSSFVHGNYVATVLLCQTLIENLLAVVGAVAELVGIEGGVVSGVINLESSGVEASDWRPRHDDQYHEA